jgi:hypothetical protein
MPRHGSCPRQPPPGALARVAMSCGMLVDTTTNGPRGAPRARGGCSGLQVAARWEPSGSSEGPLRVVHRRRAGRGAAHRRRGRRGATRSLEAQCVAGGERGAARSLLRRGPVPRRSQPRTCPGASVAAPPLVDSRCPSDTGWRWTRPRD